MRGFLFLLFTFVLIFFLASHAHAAIQFLIFEPVVSGLEITLSASISGLTSISCNSDGKCFLQGTLRQTGAPRYFGQTQNNLGSWIDYVSLPELEYIQSNFSQFSPNSGSWSGQLKMRFSVDDDEYQGPADYELKLRRFSGKSTSPAGDSNILIISLTAAIPTPTPTAISTPTPTPMQTTTPAPFISPTPTPTKITTKSPTLTPSATSPSIKIATSASPSTSLNSVLGESILGSTDSAQSTAVLSPDSQSGSSSSPPLIAGKEDNREVGPLTIFGITAATVTLLSLAFWRLRRLTRLDRVK